MKMKRRQKMFVDCVVQGALLRRICAYWLFCVLSVTQFVCCWTILTNWPDSFAELFLGVWNQYGPALIFALLLLPLLIYDFVQVSNRFAGPMLRLRRAMKDLSEGRPVDAITLRDTDFWLEYTEDFNRLAERLNSEHSPDDEPVTAA